MELLKYQILAFAIGFSKCILFLFLATLLVLLIISPFHLLVNILGLSPLWGMIAVVVFLFCIMIGAGHVSDYNEKRKGLRYE